MAVSKKACTQANCTAGAVTLFGNGSTGVITEVEYSPSSGQIGLTTVRTGGSRGDFATIGPDGCLYASQSDSVIKVANPNGGCPFGGFYNPRENPSPCPALFFRRPRIVTFGRGMDA